MLFIFGQDCLINGSSTTLVTKKKQSTGTHFGEKVLHWQLRSRTHTFAECNGRYLFNVQQSLSQANKNLLQFEAGELQLQVLKPSFCYQRTSGLDKQTLRHHHPQEETTLYGNKARVKVSTMTEESILIFL